MPTTLALLLALTACGTTGTLAADTATTSADCPQADTTTPVLDDDGDGYTAALDCDDGDPLVGPPTAAWLDADGDGYGDSARPVSGCAQLSSYVDNPDDCDDDDPDVHPGTLWYPDGDGDGYGDPTAPTPSCVQLYGYVANADDCDDDDPDTWPGAAEACDGVDQDCDGLADNGAPTTSWCPDADGDGYGSDDPALRLTACSPDSLVGDPAGWSTSCDDCDDMDAATYPGAPETWYGGDQACDGV